MIEAITTLAEAERQFQLARTEDETFFPEWQTGLPILINIERTELTAMRRRYLYQQTFFPEWQTGLPILINIERTELTAMRRRYLYQRTEAHLLEGTVTLLFASPLLTIAGFYDLPFKIRAEEAVQINLKDSEEILQRRLDVLVLEDQLWVVVLKSKKTALSIWPALPQTLAYLMASPQPELPRFSMMTNGDNSVFVKLAPSGPRQYDFSRVFAALTSNQELYRTLQILKRTAQVTG